MRARNETGDNDEGTYNPFAERNIAKPLTDFGAFSHLMKTTLGVGVFALPFGFARAGLVVGIILTPLIDLIILHCSYILVLSSQELCYRSKSPSLTYFETSIMSFKYGPKSLQACAKPFGAFVNVALVLGYFATCSAYTTFMATATNRVMQRLFKININIRWYAFLYLPLYLIIAQARHLKILVPFSVVANICLFTSLMIGIYHFLIDIPPLNSMNMANTLDNWPVCIEMIFFASQFVGLVLPIENVMIKPKHIIGVVGVLPIVTLLISVFYTLIGTLGYIRYRDEAEPLFLLNITDITGDVGNILIIIAIGITYGLQFFVAMQITWHDCLVNVLPENRRGNFIETVVRCLCVLVITAFAVFIPFLDIILGFVSAVFFTTLAVLCPVVIETSTFWDQRTKKIPIWFIKNMFLLIFYFTMLFIGIYMTIRDTIEAYKTQ